MKRFLWLVILALIAVSVVAFENWKEAEKLRRENEVLRRSIDEMQAQIAAATTKQNSADTAEREQQRKNSEELLHLRSEATQLRAKAADAAKLRAENQQLRAAIPAAASPGSSSPGTNAAAGNQYPKESWAFSGYATPEATLVSAIWAMREGNPRAYLDSLSPDEQARQSKLWENKSDADIAAKHQQDVANITGFQILSSQNISPDEVQMSVFVAGPDKTEQVSLVRNGSDWKFAGFVPSPPK